MLFGSNYPMIAPAAALEDLDGLGLDDEARELYLGGNARRVFDLAGTGSSARRAEQRARVLHLDERRSALSAIVLERLARAQLAHGSMPPDRTLEGAGRSYLPCGH